MRFRHPPIRCQLRGSREEIPLRPTSHSQMEACEAKFCRVYITKVMEIFKYTNRSETEFFKNAAAPTPPSRGPAAITYVSKTIKIVSFFAVSAHFGADLRPTGRRSGPGLSVLERRQKKNDGGVKIYCGGRRRRGSESAGRSNYKNF